MSTNSLTITLHFVVREMEETDFLDMQDILITCLVGDAARSSEKATLTGLAVAEGLGLTVCFVEPDAAAAAYVASPHGALPVPTDDMLRKAREHQGDALAPAGYGGVSSFPAGRDVAEGG